MSSEWTFSELKEWDDRVTKLSKVNNLDWFGLIMLIILNIDDIQTGE